jgi:4-amino-4-deoxy-L-arabinose transferase-like glycosyltransferase
MANASDTQSMRFRVSDQSTVATTSISSRRPWLGSKGCLAFAILTAVTVVRLIGLRFSVVDFFYDESQYWSWSREVAFGYFSKPPLLVWVIAIAGKVCGNSEACIRAPAPLFYLATSLVVYAIARELYGTGVALFAALSICLATGVVFSARIISTDVPLLFFWALALLAYVKLLKYGGLHWAALLGVSLGFGLLAKYAMVYFFLGVALAAWLDRDARRILCSGELWLAVAIAAFMIAPNLAWNFQNGLATFRHAGQSINGSNLRLDPFRAIEFVASQFGVFGPVLFAALLLAIARTRSPKITRADRLMLAFAIPPLALITAVALTTRAGGNWAAPAFISGTIVAVALLVHNAAWKWLAASMAVGVIIQLMLLVGDAKATRVHVPLLGDVYSRTLGWRSLGEQVGALSQREGARSIVGDSRYVVASLLYYWRDQPQKIFAWLAPWEDFELTPRFTEGAPQPILYISEYSVADILSTCYAKVEILDRLQIPTGPTTSRYYFAYKLVHPRGRIGPLQACR